MFVGIFSDAFFRFSGEFAAERILQNRSQAVEVMNYLNLET